MTTGAQLDEISKVTDTMAWVHLFNPLDKEADIILPPEPDIINNIYMTVNSTEVLIEEEPSVVIADDFGIVEILEENDIIIEDEEIVFIEEETGDIINGI